MQKSSPCFGLLNYYYYSINDYVTVQNIVQYSPCSYLLSDSVEIFLQPLPFSSFLLSSQLYNNYTVPFPFPF